MYRRTVLTLALAFSPWWHSGAGDVQFRVFWIAAPPTAVAVNVDTDVVNLSMNSAKQRFDGAVSPGAQLLRDADLDVTYNGQEPFSIPLRLSAKTTEVALWVNLPSNPSCNLSRLDELRRQTKSDLRSMIAAYIEARAIYNLQGSNRCGSVLRPRAAKLWFDSSYALVRKQPYFRLDEAAKDACAEFDEAYVVPYAREDQALAVKVLNDVKLKQIKAGDFGSAAATNTAIQAKLSSDADLARAAQEKQGISETLLNKDGAYLAAMKGSQQE